VVNCTSSAAGLDCSASQSLFIKETGQRLLSVALRIPADTRKPVLMLQVPLGIYLPAGVTLQIGKDAARKVALQSCDQNGCLAEYPITAAEIDAMLKGADLSITVQNLKQEPITVPVAALGFPLAYAKIK
jgi:invasion protein IalB